MDDRSKPAQRNDIPKIDAANNEAARGLRAVEAGAASDKPKETGDNLDANRANEAAANGFYTGTGRELISVKGKGKGKSFLKSKGPIGLIIALIMGCGGLMAGTQFFQPFALVENLRELYNSMHVSTNKRSDVFFKMQMGKGKYANPIKGHVFGNDTFKITPKQRNRLAKQGIEVDEVNGTTVLRFDDGSGTIKTIVADPDDIGRVGGDAIDFKTAYRDNPDFFNGYNQGSMTWRGAISNWFSSVTAKFLSKNRITRNMFKDFIEKTNRAEAGNTRRYALEKMAEGTDSIEEPGSKMATAEDQDYERTEVGEDGVSRTVHDVVEDQHLGAPASSGKGRISRAQIKANPELVGDIVDNVKKKFEGANKGAGTAQKVVNVTCAGVNFLGALSLMASAAEALQIINLISGYTEAVDKTKAGLGDESPLTDLTDALNERRKNTHISIFGNTTDESSSEKTAMESEGFAAVFQGTKINTKDPSVKSFNVSSNMLSFTSRTDVFETCMIAKAATNLVSAGIKIAEIGTCFAGLVGALFTFGASIATCLPLLGDIGTSIALGVAATVAISAIVAVITPVLTNILTRDLISDIGGEDLGNALTSGGNMVMGNNHRSNGGSLATQEKYVEFAVAQQEVIAENARLERMNRSPFDITSKYTFMGSLITQFMSFLSTSSVMSAISTSTNVLSSSIASLSPTATASSIAKNLPDLEEYKKTCPYLASIGAIGDAFCNPYAITDITTINEDPAQIINEIGEDQFADELTSDGNVKIAGNSDLAKYMLYCNNRESTFGVADQNIADDLQNWARVRTKNGKLNSVANAAIGAVPVFGDIVDMFQSVEALEGIGYISGESCVAGNDVNAAKSPNWERAKLYQRFFEDQSLAETMGVIEKSAVTAFLEEYYEEHPLDNTYEGILARYSGLQKDQVVAVLNYLELANYIADYDPTTRHQFGEPEVVMPNQILFDTENYVAEAPAIILTNAISFADVRNRVFVV